MTRRDEKRQRLPVSSQTTQAVEERDSFLSCFYTPTAIARSKIGSVFRARWSTAGGTEVVVKVVMDEKKRRGQEKNAGGIQGCLAKEALREATVLLETEYHPCIVSLLSVWKEEDHTVFVLQPAETDLHDWIKEAHPAPFHVLSKIVTCVCSALAHIHSKGVMHRDVKPKNVLYTPRLGRVLLADFGIARKVEEEEGEEEGYTQTGTFWYSAPEVLLNVPYDERVDLWSLGATIAHLYAGVPLIISESTDPDDVMDEILAVVGSSPTRLVGHRLKDAPLPVWDDSFLAQPSVVRSLLSYDPSSRPTPGEVPSLFVDPDTSSDVMATSYPPHLPITQ